MLSQKKVRAFYISDIFLVFGGKVGQRISDFGDSAAPWVESTHSRVLRHPQENFLSSYYP